MRRRIGECYHRCPRRGAGADEERSPIAKELRTNEQIFAPRVRVVQDTDQLGIMETREAQSLADEARLDLVEVAPGADPPVVRIMDYGKYRYEQAKKERESRKSSRHSSLREVRMRVKIDEHDIAFKARTARKLLAEGDKVKISVMFRAREITHPEVGRELIDRFYERISDVATVERPAQMEGRTLSMVVMPDLKRREEEEPEPAAAGGGA